MAKPAGGVVGLVGVLVAGWAGGLDALTDRLPLWVLVIMLLTPSYLALSWDLRQWFRPRKGRDRGGDRQQKGPSP